MPGPVELTKEVQRRWAKDRSCELDAQGYTRVLRDNLFEPLSTETTLEFSEGDGGELGSDGHKGKMQALHSSSALACNVFDYWRHRNARPLAAALGLSGQICSLRFEQKFPTGLPGNAPNLDVALLLDNGTTFAIESKFLEVYGRHSAGFKPKYFEHESGLWASRGFGHCESLARALYDGSQTFRWLHAEQLLKHVLGLSTAGGRWHLHYLWYRVDHEHAKAHEIELDVFRTLVLKDRINFSAQTYQALFAKLETCGAAGHGPYVEYLRRRYFQQ
ncbi:MAG: hypothetical protein SF172_18725 [Burkholderiales bacterium]|nr:hypothetical protein [Burkholderiales bacterium]